MSGETIELLKGYDPKKMQFPAYLSEKLDGVPVRMWASERQIDSGKVHAFTRQGELCVSIPEIVEMAEKLLAVPGSSFVGELYIKGKPFKEISGLARQHAPAPELQLWVFDADITNQPSLPYDERLRLFVEALHVLKDFYATAPISVIPFLTVENDAAVQHVFGHFSKLRPDAEGVVIHSKAKTFQPGKRCWGTQRLKAEPTLDLLVYGYEEAISKTGEPLDMVGRIDVVYTRVTGDPVTGLRERSVIGVGPGALTHEERRSIWHAYHTKGGRMSDTRPVIEVKYMRDDTYEALRQPTFVRFRPDKSVGDVHHV